MHVCMYVCACYSLEALAFGLCVCMQPRTIDRYPHALTQIRLAHAPTFIPAGKDALVVVPTSQERKNTSVMAHDWRIQDFKPWILAGCCKYR